MSQASQFTFTTFLVRFTLRLALWIACSAVAAYSLKCYEKTYGGFLALESNEARPVRESTEFAGDDPTGSSGAIVGVAMQDTPRPQRYVARPIVPFRHRFRGFVYESVDGSPVAKQIAVAPAYATNTDGLLVEGKLSGYRAPTGVDLTTEPFRLGNITPVPHPAGGWFLLCGVACLMLLPGARRDLARRTS